MKIKYLGLALLCFCLLPATGYGRGPANTGSATISSSPSSQRVNLSFLGGLGTTTTKYVGTFLVGVGIPISSTNPVRVLFESGIIFGSGTLLPLLISIQFPIGDQNRSFRPYFTGTVGPSIGIGGRGVLHGVVDDVLMTFLIRPGAAWKIEERLDVNIEMIVGGFTGLFYIGPNVGMRVYF